MMSQKILIYIEYEKSDIQIKKCTLKKFEK